ncbi:hypothetical protein HGRIS_003825 [Hohenbuehelia grisea]|uniref:Cytochrome P450 n=1 Tax=Hohenbuehelia grisea TaxID=104357 RepID=A0ABR3JH94_9AGAR
MDLSSISLAIAAAVFFFTMYIKVFRRRPSAPLPPGPSSLPLIGNILDMPAQAAWIQYDRWLKEYGDIVHVEVLGKHIIILGSPYHISNLLEKRSSIYSNRPRMPMLNELMGWDFTFGLMPYGTLWRKHRKLFHDYFNPGVVERYQETQQAQTKSFMRRLHHSPDEFLEHIRHAFASTIMMITYGIQVLDSGDPYIDVAEKAVAGVTQAVHPGRFLVDLFPILKYVPAWVPGAGFRKKAARWAAINHTLVNAPYEATKASLSEGKVASSIVAEMISNLSKDHTLREEQEEIAKGVAATAYAGGADTTVSTVQTFFLAMAMHPHVQKKAQAELDSVIGAVPDRLPDFSDRDVLSYTQALVLELLRWNMVAPAGVPHACTEDNVYEGYLIPKGSLVIASSWSLSRDPTVYPEPNGFNPGRFLKDGKINPDMKDPRTYCFGFGRRICPGRHFAENSLWSIVTGILSVFTITPKTEVLTAEMTGGALSYPVPFQ